MTDRDDGFDIAPRHGEPRQARLRSIDKQSHRLGGNHVCERVVCIRKLQRSHAPHGFAGGAQWRAARGDDVQPGTRGQQRVGEVRAGSEQVLAVVEHDEGLSAADVSGERLGRHLIRLFGDAERPGKRQRHQPGVTQVCEFDQPGTVHMLSRDVPRQLHGEPRLAHTASSG